MRTRPRRIDRRGVAAGCGFHQRQFARPAFDVRRGRAMRRPRHVDQLFCEIEALQSLEALTAQKRKLVEKFSNRLACNRVVEPETVEWFEGPRVSMLKNDAQARNPICLFSVDQVTQNIKRAEGVGRLSRVQPCGGFSAQQSAENGWRFG